MTLGKILACLWGCIIIRLPIKILLKIQKNLTNLAEIEILSSSPEPLIGAVKDFSKICIKINKNLKNYREILRKMQIFQWKLLMYPRNDEK